MRKILVVLAVVLLGVFLLAGCSTEAKPTGAVSEVDPMDEAIALDLVKEALAHQTHVQSGGNISGDLETFDYNGMDFRYLGEDLQPKSELLRYLEEAFTPEAAEELIQGYIEKDGKMAQPNADGGSILQWDRAEVSLIQESGNSKEYAFKVPYGDESDLQYETIPVQVTFVPDSGWRVAGWTGLF